MTIPISLRDWLAYCGKNGCRGKDLIAAGQLWKSVYREKGPFVIKYKSYILPYEFPTRSKAEAWARRNYYGRSGWTILAKSALNAKERPHD